MEKIETPVNRLRRIFNESGTISDLDWQEAIEAEQIEMMTAVDLFVNYRKFTEDAFKTWYAENYDENSPAAKPMLAAGLSTEHDLKTAIALGLDKCWDSDWIISTSKSTGGAIHFSVHLDYIGQIDTDNVEIKTIEMDGCWLRLSGWVK